MANVYKGFDQQELDIQYKAAATVPNMQDFIDDYISLSSIARDTLDCISDLRFGPSDTETLDLFPVPDAKNVPLFIFIHGGYWRMLSKNESSFMAPNLVKNGIAVAIAGKPNAGKSTFFNSLIKENRSIVSSKAGTTRDAVSKSITFKNDKIELFDTAGLRKKSKRLIKFLQLIFLLPACQMM